MAIRSLAGIYGECLLKKVASEQPFLVLSKQNESLKYLIVFKTGFKIHHYIVPWGMIRWVLLPNSVSLHTGFRFTQRLF